LPATHSTYVPILTYYTRERSVMVLWSLGHAIIFSM
jgi:hypothetical protein